MQNSISKISLTIALLFLQGFSLATTIEGCKILFPEGIVSLPANWKMFSQSGIPTYLLLGIGIQFLLILFLVFNAIKDKPKSIIVSSIIILTFFSTYTSFFSFYNQVTGNLLDGNPATNYAIDKHDKLKGFIYDTYKNKQQELEEIIKSSSCTMAQEDKKSLSESDIQKLKASGCDLSVNRSQGKGEKYRLAEENYDKANNELPKIKAYIERIEAVQFQINEEQIINYFNISDKVLLNMNAKEIYRLDRTPFSIAKNKFNELKKIGFNAELFDEEVDYIPPQTENKSPNFLVPIQEIFIKFNIYAFISLLIAAIIDLISLILGTNFQRNDFSETIKECFLFISDIIIALFDAIYIILKAISYPCVSIFTSSRKQIDKLQSQKFLLIERDESASEFLAFLINQINFQTKEIKQSDLLSYYKNKSFAIYYKILIDCMINNKIFKLEQNNQLILNNKLEFTKWFKKQYQIALQRDKKNVSDYSKIYLPKN